MNITAKRKRASAFTLFEILVVIGLMALLGGALGLALWPGENGQVLQLQTSQRTAASLFSSARLQAIIKNTEARLIIHNDDSDPEKNLRYLGFIYKDPQNPDGDEWMALLDGVFLPSGVYFLETLSSPLNTMRIAFPKTRASAGVGEQWYYYQIDSNGTAATNTAGSRIVFSTLRVDEESNPEQIQNQNLNQIHKSRGLVIHKTGSVSLFTGLPNASNP